MESAARRRRSRLTRLLPWVSTLVVLACGGLVGAWVTDGYRAFTSETARRLVIQREKPRLPAAALQDSSGLRLGASSFSGKVLIVDFIYTSCETLCSALGGVFGALQRELSAPLEQEKIHLLSIAFDLERDSLAALQAYGKRFHAGQHWSLTRLPNRLARNIWFDTFGVVAIADGREGYVHNAGLSVVGNDGRIRAVFDAEDWQSAAEFARELTKEAVSEPVL